MPDDLIRHLEVLRAKHPGVRQGDQALTLARLKQALPWRPPGVPSSRWTSVPSAPSAPIWEHAMPRPTAGTPDTLRCPCPYQRFSLRP